MQLIEEISEMIDSELESACQYAKCALNHKEDNPQLADVFYNISTEKMKHIQMLHNQVVMIINEYKKTHGEPPEGMKTLYDYLHRKQMERASEVKAKQNMFKE